MVGHAKCQACAAQVFGAVRGFHAGQSQIRDSGILQADWQQKLNGVIVVLGNGGFIIRFQDPSGLPQRSVKKLNLHSAASDVFRKSLDVFFIIKNMFILWDNRKFCIKYEIRGVFYITRPLRQIGYFRFQKRIVRIKSIQIPVLPIRHKIWHKISVNRLIIMIKESGMKKGIVFFLHHLPLFIQTPKCIFQIAFQNPIVLRVSVAPFFRRHSGQILNLTVIIPAVGKIK